MLNLVNSITLEPLTINDEVKALAGRYIKEGLIPSKHGEDAIHIAIAAVYNLDAIVSWNFEHMIKRKTKHGVLGVNELLGYKVIEIITPMEVD